MIPQISRLRSFANSFRFVKDPISAINGNLQQLGPTYGMYLGGLKAGILSIEPEIIQQILQKNHRNYPKSPMHFEKLAYFLGNGLLTSTGDYWLRQRRLIQPGFHRQKLAALTDIMQDTIEQQLDRFEQRIDGEVDAYTEMMEMAFRVVAASLFSTALTEEELQKLSYAITTLQEFIVRQIRQPYLNPWFRISGQVRKHERLTGQADSVIKNTIRKRQANQEKGDDLLQMLMDARYEDTGEPMGERQLLDESKIIFVAGHETSANALSWTWYLLALHPEVTQKIRDEIRAVLEDRRPTFSDLPKLAYTSQVIEESMRLYPPAWITDRLALETDEIKGVKIPAGTIAVPYIYGAHHNPATWSDPETFDPDRFSPENRKKIPAYAYLPFGGGPRLCIGNNFAIMEMQLILVEMIRRYNFELVPGQEIQMKALVTLRPYPGVRMKFSRRP
ncbi:cytochrome P450 [Flavilitoribacter nigricans]|uniref:Cytochrome P450 n=1 Tax=Flavilitoribacter nigricans (strain ATCC 23147 / DSM 23189 / NBRC 102662 / NCIMB 1420 / SS-2) TaxID=1122177 RepID=A0A2D0NAR3_FLAN2|nr:cytochrome P450 [Flavilitoribacter nigricans]PHN04853.1 cytochrome P450 [Flavilitoribacter nigricans DSM 23189 = NBRC 102662]